MPDDLAGLAGRVVRALADRGRTVATAESCTGGWIAKALTDVAGSSAVFGYGLVSYSNGAKAELLGVDTDVIRTHGAVSRETVTAMAEGALRVSGADFAVAVSGIAGPDGGSPDKPVGTVWFAISHRLREKYSTEAECRRFEGDRDAVRRQTVIHALEQIRDRLT